MISVGKNQDQAGLAGCFRTEKPSTQGIPIGNADSLTTEEFKSCYVDKNLPILVRGALSPEWNCMSSWNVAYLKDTVGHVELAMRVNPSSDGTFGAVQRLDDGQVSLYDFETVTFHTFLDSLGKHPPQHYPARVELCTDFPELIPDIPSFYDLSWRTAFGCPYKNGATSYFGPGGQTTPLHYDTLENLTFMVSGSKTFKLFPPSESSLLRPAPRSLGTHYSLLTPREAKESGAVSYEATLTKGDMLYLPNCWWHCVQGGDGFNISLNYWFCQHPDKEDYDIYTAYLRSAFDRTLTQLQSMRLPQSVLDEAEKDAESSIQTKLNQRKLFSWTEPS